MGSVAAPRQSAVPARDCPAQVANDFVSAPITTALLLHYADPQLTVRGRLHESLGAGSGVRCPSIAV